MSGRIRRCLVGATVLASLLFVTPALADVTVRVEGDAQTLLPETVVPATGPTVGKDGGTCSGATGAGVLDRAVAGGWSGTWNAAFGDWEVTAIKGEQHSFASAAYWTFFVNDVPAALGVCGQAIQNGDRVLFAPAPTSFDPVGVLRLSGVPSRVTPGTPFTVTVTRVLTTYDSSFNPVTSTDPLAGAAIEADGGVLATTGGDGTAQVTLPGGGPVELRATHAGDVRSVPAATCATTGSDGRCGSGAPAAAVAPATAAPDTTPALGTIAALGEQQRFARGRGPRTLSGVVDPGATGLREVRLRLTRRIPATAGGHKACSAYDATRETWVSSKRCGVGIGRWFAVGDRASWSYLLPARLGPGRYVLDIQTTDGAGNVSPLGLRGRDPAGARTQVVFVVRG